MATLGLIQLLIQVNEKEILIIMHRSGHWIKKNLSMNMTLILPLTVLIGVRQELKQAIPTIKKTFSTAGSLSRGTRYII